MHITCISKCSKAFLDTPRPQDSSELSRQVLRDVLSGENEVVSGGAASGR